MSELERNYGPGSWDWIDDSMSDTGTGGVEGHAHSTGCFSTGLIGNEEPKDQGEHKGPSAAAGLNPGPVPLQATEDDIKRFFKYVDKLPNGCWFWTGARSRGGGNRKWYGSFHLNGKVIRAHRFSAEVIGGKGPLPPGGHRDHECVFSLCVNPAHIEYVTREENQQRKMARKC